VDRTAQMVVTSLGGNYGTRLRVYLDCPAVTLISGTNRAEDEWVQRSQTITQFAATLGTQYWFRHTDNNLGNAAGVARLHLFERKTPETGDIFISCQHIYVLRDHATTPFPVNATPDLYGFTPTGSAIDTSGVAMDDQNGGTHTGNRYLTTLFGGTPVVEILDLTTLNYLQSEIDFILSPLAGADNASSLVFDREGNIIVSFFGDNYDYLGVTATPPTADIKQLPITHGDNQAGAPWPLATSFAVQYGSSGSDYAELSSDQDTIWYTSAGQTIKRFDRTTQTQLADVANVVPALPGPRPGVRSFRLGPPGDGSDGGLVANGSAVHLVDGTGVIVRTYSPTPASRAQDLDKVEICNDREHFIVSDQLSTSLFKFNILTGAQIWEVITDLPTGQLCGFSIFNGYRAGIEEPPPETPPEETPIPEGCPIEFVTGPLPERYGPLSSKFGRLPRSTPDTSSCVTATQKGVPLSRLDRDDA
jgi:hypothetical protein